MRNSNQFVTSRRHTQQPKHEPTEQFNASSDDEVVLNFKEGARSLSADYDLNVTDDKKTMEKSPLSDFTSNLQDMCLNTPYGKSDNIRSMAYQHGQQSLISHTPALCFNQGNNEIDGPIHLSFEDSDDERYAPTQLIIPPKPLEGNCDIICNI